MSDLNGFNKKLSDVAVPKNGVMLLPACGLLSYQFPPRAWDVNVSFIHNPGQPSSLLRYTRTRVGDVIEEGEIAPHGVARGFIPAHTRTLPQPKENFPAIMMKFQEKTLRLCQ